MSKHEKYCHLSSAAGTTLLGLNTYIVFLNPPKCDDTLTFGRRRLLSLEVCCAALCACIQVEEISAGNVLARPFRKLRFGPRRQSGRRGGHTQAGEGEASASNVSTFYFFCCMRTLTQRLRGDSYTNGERTWRKQNNPLLEVDLMHAAALAIQVQ